MKLTKVMCAAENCKHYLFAFKITTMKIMPLFFLLFSASLAGQNKILEEAFPLKDGKIFYQDVIKFDSTLTTQEIKSNLLQWSVETFKDSKEVIQVNEESFLVFKSFVDKGHNPYILYPKNWFTLKIDIKEDRFRYTLTDIVYQFNADVNNDFEFLLEDWVKPSTKGSQKKQEKTNLALLEYCKELDLIIQSILNSLKESLNQTSEDW